MARYEIVDTKSDHPITYYNPEKSVALPLFGLNIAIFELSKLFSFYHTSPIEQYKRFRESAKPSNAVLTMDLLISPPPTPEERGIILRCFDTAIRTLNQHARLAQMNFGDDVYILDESIGEFKESRVVINF